jgi:predicted PurR-regulated permease PerM
MNQPIVMTFLILAIIAFLSYAAEVLKPLAFAVLLSFALAPVSRLIQRLGVPRTLSAALAVLLALGVIGFIGREVGTQLTSMVDQIPTFEKNLLAKLHRFRPEGGQGVLEKTSKVVRDVTKTLNNPKKAKEETDADEDEPDENAVPVRVISHRSLPERLGAIFGPTLEYLGSFAFILILVFFLLTNREDLTERLIRLVGTHRVSLTTKTMEEVDQRISRYLVTFATVNSTVGVVVGLGLALIGVPYAMLWGVLAGLLRFIPYVGPGVAFLLPFAFSIASAPGSDLRQPLLVLGLFAALEILANSYLEPVIYGKTTGVSSFGLLVAAMFWTWLWGAIGLFLSTPLTVCLAVVGKYVPGLHAFAVLLGEEPPLTPDVQFYQRLLAMDQDGATAFVDDLLKRRPRAEVFDEILIPTLARAEHDFARGDIEEREQAFIWRVIDDLLVELADTPELDLKALAAADAAQGGAAAPPAQDGRNVAIVGVPANDPSDALALRMLDVLLTPAGLRISVMENAGSPLKIAEAVSAAQPALIVLSHVPPGGLSHARYLVRRLRAHTNDVPLLVGGWGMTAESEEAVAQLKPAGASSAVVVRLADARDRIVDQFRPQADGARTLATPPAPPAGAVAKV